MAARFIRFVGVMASLAGLAINAGCAAGSGTAPALPTTTTTTVPAAPPGTARPTASPPGAAPPPSTAAPSTPPSTGASTGGGVAPTPVGPVTGGEPTVSAGGILDGVEQELHGG